MNSQYKSLINFIIELGENIKNNDIQVLYNEKKDIKLTTDLELNEKIVSFLENNFEYQILSEESNNKISFSKYKEPIWIIDPLDGTLNFNREIPLCCITTSLWNNSKPIFACIYDFNRGDLYYIENDMCYINKKKSNVSEVLDSAYGVLCTGFPSWRDYEDDSLKNFLQKVQNWKKIRAIGSAALSLAWIARGWADAYIEEDIRIWDVAAGLALVKAAGGDFYFQENDRPNFVTAIATNGKISIKELL